MANDISGFGLKIQIVASVTFPAGFNITQFASDADPFDFAAIEIMGREMGLNGDLVTWSTPNPLDATINVIPESEDDKNLAVLYEANRVARGKTSARDVITMTAIYPSGKTLTLTQGKIYSGIPGNPVASAGRMKSKPYMFVFENKVGS